jgi:hypothetical protein
MEGTIPMLGFNKQQVKEFLAWYNYTSNPDELADFPPYYPVEVSETEAYLDISPEAVRKGDVKPDRPVRLTFRKILQGSESRWELRSVAELPPGVESNHARRS